MTKSQETLDGQKAIPELAQEIRGRLWTTTKSVAVEPGQSGNPSGKKRGAKNSATILHQIMQKKVTIREDGKQRKITVHEGLYLNHVAPGLKGDLKAAEFLLKAYAEIQSAEALRARRSATLNAGASELLKFRTDGGVVLARRRHPARDNREPFARAVAQVGPSRRLTDLDQEVSPSHLLSRYSVRELFAMTAVEEKTNDTHAFQADVAKLLQMMVHSVYSDRDVFLRELISNAADACERLRYEAIASPGLLSEDPALRIILTIDADSRRLSVEDNGIGMSHEELTQALGTIAHSGTKAFVDRLEDRQSNAAAGALIGQFGVGFYSAFMVAERVDVVSRRAGTDEAWQWSSDGKGTFTVSPVALSDAPSRGTRVVLHLSEEAKQYAERFTVERIVRAQSGHVPVPIAIIDKPGAEPAEVADGSALWTKPKSDISSEAYTDFYRGMAGHFDEPALTIHFHAEGRQEYTILAFIPGSQPFDLFDPDRTGRIKLYVKRVFITDEADVLPRYLRFVRGLVDSADLPLNVSREMIQASPLLAAIKKSITGRILSELEKLAESEPDRYLKIWDNFGTVLKEGIYEDFERRDTLLALSRFKTTTSSGSWRSLKDYLGSLKENQTAIYYLAGDDLTRLAASPHLEGFRARGVEVLLLTDPVDSFWVTSGVSFDGKPFKSVTQGASDLAAIPLLEAKEADQPEISASVSALLAFMKSALGDTVSDVRVSDRLTNSAVCLVAPERGPDRQLERILAGAGRLKETAKPILEINPQHDVIGLIASLTDKHAALKEDAAHILFEEARILDGDRPDDPRLFGDRLSRILRLALASEK